MRRVYSDDEKAAALDLLREVGVLEASKRLGISKYTLHDWKVRTKTFAYSSLACRSRLLSEAERKRLLRQLIHEQDREMRFISIAYRQHQGADDPDVSLDVRLEKTGVVQKHLLEWLDPTFDEVAERLAA